MFHLIAHAGKKYTTRTHAHTKRTLAFDTLKQVLEYDWGTALDKLSPPYDYVVACDCVYVERLVESLVWSMAQCSGRTTTVLVASEKREEVTYAKFRCVRARCALPTTFCGVKRLCTGIGWI